jgi:hypothetical protein
MGGLLGLSTVLALLGGGAGAFAFLKNRGVIAGGTGSTGSTGSAGSTGSTGSTGRPSAGDVASGFASGGATSAGNGIASALGWLDTPTVPTTIPTVLPAIVRGPSTVKGFTPSGSSAVLIASTTISGLAGHVN